MYKPMTGPICWFGGKGVLSPMFAPYFPEHETYVEPFGGGASVLFYKEPTKKEVYNDLNPGLVNFFRHLQDPDSFRRIFSKAIFSPYAREEYYNFRDNWDKESDLVDQAYQWWLVGKQSFSGHFGSSWSFSSNSGSKNKSMVLTTSSWISVLNRFNKIHERFKNVIIENMDALDLLDKYDSEGTWFYTDPPYLGTTRSGGDYQYDFKDDVLHEKLLKKLCKVKGKVMLSGYPSELYDSLLKDWRKVEIPIACMSVGRTRSSGTRGTGTVTGKYDRIEVLYMNYEVKQVKSQGLFGDE